MAAANGYKAELRVSRQPRNRLLAAYPISRSKQFIKKKKLSGKLATKIFCNYWINNYVQSLPTFRSCPIYLSWKLGVEMVWAQFWGASEDVSRMGMTITRSKAPRRCQARV